MRKGRDDGKLIQLFDLHKVDVLVWKIGPLADSARPTLGTAN
jgi:hypothetical protein